MSTTAKHIPPALRSLELPFPPKIFSLMSGLYNSQKRGSGVEFSELREYVVGDDVRSIDWKASARSHTTYIKTYIDLRNQDVVFALDGSSSMALGGVDNLDSPLFLAGAMIGLIMRLAINRGDRVGFISTQQPEHFRVQTTGLSSRALGMYQQQYVNIATAHRQGMDWGQFLEQVRRNIKKHSLIVFFSDDYRVDDQIAQGYRLLRAHGHRVWCFRLGSKLLDVDRVETVPVIEDIESGELDGWNILDRQLLEDFIAQEQVGDVALDQRLRLLGVEIATLADRESAIPLLAKLLLRYKRRGGH